MSFVTLELLDALLSADGGQRRHAEATLLARTPTERCHAWLQGFFLLLQQQQQQPPHYGCLMATLLRRDMLLLTDAATLQSLVDPVTRLFVQHASQSSSMLSLQTALGDCLVQISAVLSLLHDEAAAVQVAQHVLGAVGTLACQGDAAALHILIGLAEQSPAAFRVTVLPSLVPLVASCLDQVGQQQQQQQGASFKLAAQVSAADRVVGRLMQLAVAAAKVTQAHAANSTTTPSASQLGQTLLLPLLERTLTLEHANHTSTDALQTVLGHLMQAADEVPLFLAGDPTVAQALVGRLLPLATQSTQDAHVQLQALQVLASLLQQPALPTAKHLASTCIDARIWSLLLHHMQAGVDADVASWQDEPAALSQDDAWDGDETAAAYAHELLQVFLRHLPRQAAGAAVLQGVQAWLDPAISTTTNDWTKPRAALQALQSCLEAAPVSFAPHVPTATQAALHWAAAAHVRVQFQALLLLGALCERGSLLQHGSDEARPRVLQAFCVAAQSSCTKVAALACLGLVSYLRPADKAALVEAQQHVLPYASDLLQALVQGPLSHHRHDHVGAVVVQIRAVGAIACLAQACGPAFAPYYASVMPGLLALVQTTTTTSHEGSRLQAAALESATLVGAALGEEQARSIYGPDARTMMDAAVVLLQTRGTAVSGMPLGALLSACARIASVLGPDYQPYAQPVLEHLLARATEPADVEITNASDANQGPNGQVEHDEDAGTESMTMAIPGRGLTRVTINTSKIQEKAEAARAIYEHAVALEASFGPFAPACLDAFLPLVEFVYSSEIRATAAQTLAAVFEAACAHAESEGALQVPQVYLPRVAGVIAKQIPVEETADMENLYALADSLSEVMRSMYVRRFDWSTQYMLTKLPVAAARQNVQACLKALVACLERRSQITKLLMEDTGHDEREDFDKQRREEEDLLTPLVDSIGYTLKLYRADFVPIFEHDVAPVLAPYLTATHDVRAQLSSVCLFDDCVEHCGDAAAAKFGPMLAQGVLLGMDDGRNGQDEELKQASIYGVAQIARYAPSAALQPHAQQIIQELATIASRPKPESEGLCIFENAVSALASLVLINRAPFASHGFVKRNVAMLIFLDNLPLRADEDEAKICHAGLCDLVEQGFVSVDSDCEQLVRIIGETMTCVDEGEELVSDETSTRFAGILLRLQNEARPDRMHSAFGALQSEAQTAINSVMAQRAHQLANVVSP